MDDDILTWDTSVGEDRNGHRFVGTITIEEYKRQRDRQDLHVVLRQPRMVDADD